MVLNLHIIENIIQNIYFDCGCEKFSNVIKTKEKKKHISTD